MTTLVVIMLDKNELKRTQKLGFKVITQDDSVYPELLKNIHDPPEHLYVKGEIKTEDSLAFAVVGTRKFTNYGREAVEYLVPQLVAAGLTIVSGMARGIDAFAHQTAISAGGRTIAVLGSGINVVYPPENQELYEKISKNGAVISEYPLDFEPTNYSFPVRNRIISGMSLGTLVIEAGETSGALITAREALEQGREVFALPGSIFSPVSVGCLELIKSGAKLVRTAQDILEELNLEVKAKKLKARKVLPKSDEEKILLELLQEGPKHIDDLVRKSGLSVSTVSSVLSLMEIKGMVKNMGKMEYREVK